MRRPALVRECCSSGTHCRYSWRSDARTNTIFGMKSRVHPKYKTKYHVGNWPEYERALVRRGDITLWLSADAIDAWTPRPSGRRGGQRKFSDQAIETALTLRLVFGLPLRQAEGFLRSVLSVMRVDLDTPDHTTLSRRSQHLAIEFHRVPANEPLHLIVDSSGRRWCVNTAPQTGALEISGPCDGRTYLAARPLTSQARSGSVASWRRVSATSTGGVATVAQAPRLPLPTAVPPRRPAGRPGCGHRR